MTKYLYVPLLLFCCMPALAACTQELAMRLPDLQQEW